MPRHSKGKVAKENSERWLLTYSDLITLLMVFFILLFAMSTTNTRKFNDLTGALEKAFNNGMFQLITVGGTPGNPKTLSGTVPTEKKDLKKLRSGINKMLKEMGLKQNIVHVGQTKEGLVVTLSGSLLFYPGDVDLKPESNRLLAQISMLVKSLPNRIRVEGNTDNQSAGSGPFADNWALSSLRADAIVRSMQSHGVNPTRLSAVGLGQFHPIANNGTPTGRAENRRADIVILYPNA